MLRYLQKLFLPLLLVLFLASPPGSAASSDAQTVAVTIIGVNDFHGALCETKTEPGAAKLGRAIKDLQKRNPENTILLSAGDMLQGSVDSNLTHGKIVIDLMNELKFDAMAVGNHEFDWQLDPLKERAKQANFPFLSANTLDRNTQEILFPFKPYTILERSGVKIAVIGLTTTETSYKSHPANTQGLVFSDPVQITAALIEKLRMEGADIILLLAHLGCYVDETTGQLTGEAAELAASVQGADYLLSGHSHTLILQPMNGLLILQSGSKGQYLECIDLIYAKQNKKILHSNARLIRLEPDALQEDPFIRELYLKESKTIREMKASYAGFASTDLFHDRRKVSPLGSWICDVIRTTMNADIAFYNGGGIRASLEAGPVTYGKLYEILPFDNTIVTVWLSGAQIRSALEYGLDAGQRLGLQFSGLSVSYDETQPAGSRVVNVTLSDGTPLDTAQLYLVAVNDFMAAGGDGFSMIASGLAPVFSELPVLDAILENLASHPIPAMDGHRFKTAAVSRPMYSQSA